MPAYMVEIEHRETDQVFSYHHGDRLLHFNASLLARLHKGMPREFKFVTMDLSEAEYDLCMKHRGIEPEKIARLTGKQLREPGYAVLFDNGLFTIIDGHHRLVRRYQGGVRTMEFFVTHEEVWRHCLVEYTAEGEEILSRTIPPRVIDEPQIASHITIHPRKP